MVSHRWISASQPRLFPPLYIIERMARVDVWVSMDEAQFEREVVQFKLRPRNEIHPVQQTVQLRKAGRKAFKDIELVDPQAFTRKLHKTTQHMYGACTGYAEMEDDWLALLERLSSLQNLAEVCTTSCEFILQQLKVPTPLIPSCRVLPEGRPESGTDWLVDLALALQSGNYLQGKAGLDAYVDMQKFAEQDIKVWYQDFTTLGIDPSMSALDLMFRSGPDHVNRVIYSPSAIGSPRPMPTGRAST